MCVLLLGLPFAAAQSPDDVPEVVRDLIERAQRLQEDDRHNDAIEAFENARELAPEIVDIYLGLGAAHLASGDAEASFEAFAAGLDIAPDHRNLLFNASVVGLRLNRLDRAVGWTTHAITVHDEDVELHLVHATVLARLERDAEALQALEAADELSPRTPSILFRLGNQLHKVGESERAVQAFRDAIDRDRKMLRAHYNLGAVLFELERDDEALAAYGIALEPFDERFRAGTLPEPIHAQAYANLGAIHTRRRDWPAAVVAYDKALRLRPEQTAWLYNRGFVHFRAGHDDAARGDYTAALAQDADLPLAYLHLGQLDRRAGDCSAAVGRLEQGLDRFDTRQRLAALEMMAYCYAELGRPERAEAAFRDVLAESPDDPELLLGLGRLLRRRGQADEARSLLDRSLTLRQGHLPTQLELLALAESGKDPALQRRMAESLLAEHGERPELWRVRWSLALSMLGEGRLADARGHLARLTDSAAVPDAERPRVAALEAMASAAEGDLDTARRRLQDAATRGDASAAAAVLDALDGDAGQAVEILARTTPTDGPWTADQTNLGLLQWSLGRPDSARALLAIAAAAGDANPAIDAALGDMALRDGEAARAAQHFDSASTDCTTSAPLPTEPGRLRVRLPAPEKGLCAWIDDASRRARLQSALDQISTGRARDPGGVRRAAESVLGDATADAFERTIARYLRGVARATTGETNGAIDDLLAALDADLPGELAPAARLELGVHLAESGQHIAARGAFEAVRSNPDSDRATRLAATLNLAILLDDHLDDSRAALDLYETYLQGGGTRAEVEGWAGRLREIYR